MLHVLLVQEAAGPSPSARSTSPCAAPLFALGSLCGGLFPAAARARARSAVEIGQSNSTRSYTKTCMVRNSVAQRRFSMKIILWIVGIIFLIGLLTVLGVGNLIF
jgi:hypothetical protein